MKKLWWMPILVTQLVFSQSVKDKLDAATQSLMKSPQALSSNLSFYVAEDGGNMVYDYQGSKGLSSASTQKIFTAAAALELLGKDYKYKTHIGSNGVVENGVLKGDLIIQSEGDPTLGSWRYDGYKPENFISKIKSTLRDLGIREVEGSIVVDDTYFDVQTIPGGWPWDDLGNYYGAGTWGVNWRENQFDVNIKGDQFVNFSYPLENVVWFNELKVGGNSDQSLVFTAPRSNVAYINGSLPAGKVTTVSGSTPNPPLQLAREVKDALVSDGVKVKGEITTGYDFILNKKSVPKISKVWSSYQSPSLDKIVYWFMRKSINLYGETLLKTIAQQVKGRSDFKTGVAVLKDFWKSKGISSNMINFADGSGLSPQNYVSAKAEVLALEYAKKQKWFDVFYEGFPTQNNGMKMKSGTMRDTKSFAGYHKSKDGKTYTFGILLNNYPGSGSEALQTVLNALK